MKIEEILNRLEDQVNIFDPYENLYDAIKVLNKAIREEKDLEAPLMDIKWAINNGVTDFSGEKIIETCSNEIDAIIRDIRLEKLLPK